MQPPIESPYVTAAEAVQLARWQARLWERLDRTAPHGCWLWTGPVNRHGYGSVSLSRQDPLNQEGRQSIGVHRAAFLLRGGVLPPGHEAMHTCDSHYAAWDHTYRRCCNPAHIRAGTHQENMQDMLDKGRSSSRCGEQAPNARITAEQVRAIRARYAQGLTTQRALAGEYQLTQAAISYIVTGNRWGHVE